MPPENAIPEAAGPAKGDFVPPPPITDVGEEPQALPSQQEFFRPPVRFGTIPVEKEPLRWVSRLLIQATQLTAQHSLSKP